MKSPCWLVVLVVLAVAPNAIARERVAVYVSAEGDPALAENLSEVTIAKLAEKGAYELVGTRELEASSRDIPTVKEGGLDACVEISACLAEVGVRANAKRAVIGKLRRQGPEYEIELRLVRTDTSHTEGKKVERTSSEVASLIAAVQKSAGELMDAAARSDVPVAASAPILTAQPGVPPAPPPAAVPPPSTEASRAATSDVSTVPSRHRTSWTTYAGFGSAGLAVIAFSTAAITGSIAKAPPSGDTRKERQDDIERRENYATAASVAFVAGGVFSASAVIFFVWP